MIAVPLSALPGCVRRAGDPTTVIEAIAIDSRGELAGALFVAIRTGHDHVVEAVSRGAVAVLVEDGREQPLAVPVLTAPDTVVALGAIGAQNRARASCTVVGVTGSSGKTSTKDVIATIGGPQRRIVAALEGHNNEIGLPFTLSRIRADTEVAVCELSMRAPGEIAALAAMARPTIGVITNVGEAHLERLGSRGAIASAKAELLDVVRLAVIPADEPLLAGRIPPAIETVTFGESPGADVRIRTRAVLGDRMSLALDVRGIPVVVDTNLLGRHHALNLAAAFAVADLLGLDLAACADAARCIALQHWRSEDHPLPGGGVIVNDAYNANPSATRAALAALAERGSGRLVAVLGEMAELGLTGPELHALVGDEARRLGYSEIVAVGPLARHYLDRGDGIWLKDATGLLESLAAVVRPDDRVLVKASRSAGLERIAQDLAAHLSNRT